jgi:hypothetical protein
VVLHLGQPNRFDVLRVDVATLQTEPAPPRRKTETAFGVEDIPDPRDPAYIRAHNLWQVERGLQTLDFYLLEYVQVAVPDPLPADLLTTYRRLADRGLAAPYDLTTADGCKLAYLRRVLRDGELRQVQQLLRRRAGPSEEEIRAAEAAFPSPLPGPAPDR